jgi:hypothetical protein
MARVPDKHGATAVIAALAALTLQTAVGVASAQQPQASPSARERAPIDITGNWVSLITDDWVYRMLTPAKGDYAYVPLNANGRAVADTWDPAADEAAGEECRGYAAPAIMRLPSRIEISWQDEQTLKLDIDTGMQTRLFHFSPQAEPAPPSWQGTSIAEWEVSGDASRRRGFYRLSGSLGDVESFGSLKVETSNLRPGYLRKNGVPYSDQAFMAEYYNLIVEDDGTEYLVIQIFVDDPVYLAEHFVRSVQFKREQDASKRAPTECSAR